MLARTSSNPRRSLGFCQLLLAASIAWAAWMIPGSLPHWPINPSLSLSPWFNFQLDLARSLWVVLPAALMWGASFPLALSAAARTQGGGPDSDPDAGRWVGGLYAANTLGSILGALGFSLALVPILGTQGSERVILLLAVGSAGIALWPEIRGSSESPARSTVRYGLSAALAASTEQAAESTPKNR